MQEHNEWIAYAENDLKAAQHLLASSDGSVILPALYMTQQCAEKALKAFLIYKGVNPGKIHDLRDLVNKCIQYDQEFSSLKEDTIALNPYNLGARYPDTFLPTPDVAAIDASINSAAAILELVKNKII